MIGGNRRGGLKTDRRQIDREEDSLQGVNRVEGGRATQGESFLKDTKKGEGEKEIKNNLEETVSRKREERIQQERVAEWGRFLSRGDTST